MADELKVLTKDGFSYVRLGDRYGHGGGGYLVNGEPPVFANGDKSYALVNGDITSIQRQIRGSAPRTGWKLADRYVGVVTLPETLPADAFDHVQFDDDGDEIGTSNRQFYNAVYGEAIITVTDVEFTVIDRDCVPTVMMAGVVVKFPENIRQYTETHHKYPCYLPWKIVYGIVRQRIMDRVEASNGKYVFSEYKSLESLTVTERITLAQPEIKRESYYASSRSRKTSFRNVEIRYKTAKVFTVNGEYQRREGSDSVRFVLDVHGTDYADLLNKLEAYVQTFMDELTDGKRQVCPTCKGEGIIHLTEVTV